VDSQRYTHNLCHGSTSIGSVIYSWFSDYATMSDGQYLFEKGRGFEWSSVGVFWTWDFNYQSALDGSTVWRTSNYQSNTGTSASSQYSYDVSTGQTVQASQATFADGSSFFDNYVQTRYTKQYVSQWTYADGSWEKYHSDSTIANSSYSWYYEWHGANGSYLVDQFAKVRQYWTSSFNLLDHSTARWIQEAKRGNARGYRETYIDWSGRSFTRYCDNAGNCHQATEDDTDEIPTN